MKPLRLSDYRTESHTEWYVLKLSSDQAQRRQDRLILRKGALSVHSGYWQGDVSLRPCCQFPQPFLHCMPEDDDIIMLLLVCTNHRSFMKFHRNVVLPRQKTNSAARLEIQHPTEKMWALLITDSLCLTSVFACHYMAKGV